MGKLTGNACASERAPLEIGPPPPNTPLNANDPVFLGSWRRRSPAEIAADEDRIARFIVRFVPGGEAVRPVLAAGQEGHLPPAAPMPGEPAPRPEAQAPQPEAPAAPAGGGSGPGGGNGPYRDMAGELSLIDVNSDEGLRELVDGIYESGDPCIELDYETTGLQPGWGAPRLVQIGFTRQDGEHKVALVDLFGVDDRDPLARLLADPSIQKRIHNAPFERAWTYYHFGVEITNVMDTREAFRTLQKHMKQIGDPAERERIAPGWDEWQQRDQERKDALKAQGRRPTATSSLAAAANALSGMELPKEEQASDWGAPELTESQRVYAAMDVAVLRPVGDHLDRALEALGPEAQAELADKISRQHAAVEAQWSFDEDGRVFQTSPRKVHGKPVRGEKETREAPDRAGRLAWAALYATTAEELERIQRRARRSPVCHVSRRLLAGFFAERRAELASA